MKDVIGFVKKYKWLKMFDSIWQSLALYPRYSVPNKEYRRCN